MGKECTKSMDVQEKNEWLKGMKGVVAGLCEDVRRYRTQLEAVEEKLANIEASEERLAEIVERSLDLHIYTFKNPKTVANGYYVDAKVALEKRPSSTS